MADSYQIVFKWPSTSASHVVVTGTFDNWSQSVPMTKTGSGFEATVSVPWDTDIVYKFVVDGQWLIDHQQPQQYDGSGVVNNVTRTPSKPEPTPEPEPQPAAETEAVDVDESTPAAPVAEEPSVTAHEPPALDPASIVPEETAALIAAADSSPPAAPSQSSGLVNGSAELAVETKDFVEVKPAAEPEVVPLVPELPHATGPVPGAVAVVETPAETHSDVPVVELLPSQDALPVVQPVEEAAVANSDTGVAAISSTEPTPGEDVAPAAAPFTDAAAPIPSEDAPAKVDAADAPVSEAVEAKLPAHEAPVGDTLAPVTPEDVPAVDHQVTGNSVELAADDGPHDRAPAVEADAEPAPVTVVEAIPLENTPSTVEEPAVTPVGEVKEATPPAIEPPVTDAVAPTPADDVPAKVDEAVSKVEETPVVSDVRGPVPEAEPSATSATSAVVEETVKAAEVTTTSLPATTSEPIALQDVPTQVDDTAIKAVDSPAQAEEPQPLAAPSPAAVPASDATVPATSEDAPPVPDTVAVKAEESPAQVESPRGAETPATVTDVKDTPTTPAETKPRLNGKGTVRDKEKRRSRTMSGFGTLKGKLFPTAPSPTEEKPEFGENGESKATEDTAVEPRPKRQSIFGRMRNVSLKTMFKSSSWIIWIIPLLVAVSYAGVYGIPWQVAMPLKN